MDAMQHAPDPHAHSAIQLSGRVFRAAGIMVVDHAGQPGARSIARYGHWAWFGQNGLTDVYRAAF